MSAAAEPAEGAADPGQQPTAFTDLPSSLQSHAFALALRLHQAALRAADGQEQALALRRLDPRRVLPLVCRAWLAAAVDADALWRRVQLNLLTLTADSVPLFARWLHRHAAAVRCLVLYGRALPTVTAALGQHVGALAAALQAASGLQQLELSRALAAPLLARIDPRSLPRLHTVSADLASSSGGGSSGSGAARQRRRSTDGSSGVSELEAATVNLLSLPALAELAIQSAIEARLLASHPSLPARLRRLHFADTRDLPRGQLLPPLAALRRLASLRLYQRDGFALPGPLTALAGSLTSLHAAVRYQDDPLQVAASLTSLSSLRALWLQHAVFEAPAAVAALPALDTLALVGAPAEYAGVLRGFAAAPAGAPPPPLRALHLEAHASAVAQVPADTWQALPGLAACRHLARLELPYCRLRELPPGPWLSGLQVLDLSQNSLPDVPPALAACHQLSALNVGQQEAAAPGEAAADVALLAALPALRLLICSAGHYSASHMSRGLRSDAEAAHLARLRGALPPHVRVANSPAEWERGVGRLAATFEVSVRQERL